MWVYFMLGSILIFFWVIFCSLFTNSKIDDDYNNIFKKQILFPAINITYFGVSKNLQSKEIGTNILDYIVHTFTAYKLAGCQFITVDSLNNRRTNAFYTKYGFCNLTNSSVSILFNSWIYFNSLAELRIVSISKYDL